MEMLSFIEPFPSLNHELKIKYKFYWQRTAIQWDCWKRHGSFRSRHAPQCDLTAYPAAAQKTCGSGIGTIKPPPKKKQVHPPPKLVTLVAPKGSDAKITSVTRIDKTCIWNFENSDAAAVMIHSFNGTRCCRSDGD